MARPVPVVQPRLLQKRVHGFENGKHRQRKFKVVPFRIDGVDDQPTSVPLIIPNNREYDVKAKKLREIEGKKRSSLVTVQLAVDLLKKIDKPVAVLAICGPCRSGKSYVLSKMLGSADAFALGHEMEPKTFGIWLGMSYLDFGDYAMLLLDAEGIDAIEAEGSSDMGILVMTVLLSSFFIYNSMHVPKRTDFEAMVGFTELADAIAVDESKARRQPDSADQALDHHFPKFLWLLRDVSLAIPMKDGKEQTAKEFMIGKMSANKEVSRAILANFASFDCITLPVPHGDPDVLANIEENEAVLLPKFVTAQTHLLEYLDENVTLKRGFGMGDRVDGPMLADLLNIYLQAVNDPHGIPCLQGNWRIARDVRKREVIEKLVKEYEEEMETALRGKLPVEVEAPANLVQQSSSQVFLMQKHSQILQQKRTQLLKEMKLFIPNEEWQKALVESMDTKIQKYDDEVAGGIDTKVVIGGILLKFITENHEKSREMCTMLFNSLCTPIARKLDSQEERLKQSKKEALPQGSSDYTFKQFSEDRRQLQSNYMQRAVGPAKQKVWKDESVRLQHWESKIKLLEGYQKDRNDHAKELAAEEVKKAEVQKALATKQGELQRLKNEKDALDTKFQDTKAELDKRKDSDTANQQIQDAQKQLDEEMLPEKEETKILWGVYQRSGPPRLKDADYAMITTAWFYPKDPSSEDIKRECEKLQIDGLGTSKNLEKWKIFFGKKAVALAKVNVKKLHNLQMSDIEKIKFTG